MNSKSWMELETAESAEIILNQHNNSLGIIEEITKRLQNAPPNYVGTLARGSSDHAANFAKYAIETQIGIITSSIAPSIHSIYKTNLNYKNSLVIAISQSGKSSDVIESLIFARKQGAITLAFVNEEQSPLAQEAEYCVPLIANKERSVAATKSFIASLSRLIQFISFWKDHTELNKQLLSIPSHLLDTKNDQIK